MTRARVILAVLALVLAVPLAAEAAPRTWLSGAFGGDADPCTDRRSVTADVPTVVDAVAMRSTVSMIVSATISEL